MRKVDFECSYLGKGEFIVKVENWRDFEAYLHVMGYKNTQEFFEDAILSYIKEEGEK